MVCLQCDLLNGCEVGPKLLGVWESAEPAQPDGDAAKVAAVGFSVAEKLVGEGLRYGTSLAALFDLLVNLYYAEDVVNTDWLYCPGQRSPKRRPMLLYPFMNGCPQCSLHGRDCEAATKHNHKPGSDRIGRASAKAIAAILHPLLGGEVGLRRSLSQTGDIDFLINTKQTLILCETKASPLVSFPLAIEPRSAFRTENRDGHPVELSQHKITSVEIESHSISILMPHTQECIPLGNPSDENFPYATVTGPLGSSLVEAYIKAWHPLYDAYANKDRGRDGLQLINLTFGCGRRIDDSKNAPGIDRTDDIKKGTYQLLKYGAYYKAHCTKRILRAALIANIHAVRHGDDYIAGMSDLVWTKEHLLQPGASPDVKAVRVRDLFNLFDAILALTETSINDSCLRAELAGSMVIRLL